MGLCIERSRRRFLGNRARREHEYKGRTEQIEIAGAACHNKVISIKETSKAWAGGIT